MSSTGKPFNWYGGKEALAPLLVSLLPRHQVYVEVFGGSGALLFAKPPSHLEVFNDLDNGVVTFFRVLRDPAQAAALQQALALTPYAREEYYECLHTWQETNDPVEQARRWYVGVMMSMNSSIKNTGWSCTKSPGSNPARAWNTNIVALLDCARALQRRNLQIDHRDFARVIQAYDSEQTCFYLDPPYVPEARRKGRCYFHEMSLDDHRRLLSCIQHIKGMVLLSGYTHPIYQEALATWECLTLSVRCSSAVRAHAKRGKTAPEPWTRTECIWRNPACVHQHTTLFSALQGVSLDEEEVHT